MVEFVGAATPLSDEGVRQIMASSSVGQSELWAVLAVETSGCGYLADQRPKILFERHIFSRLTSREYDADDPDVSQPSAGGYGASGAHQYDRLNVASRLNLSAALKSASWGLGQIMGENFAAAGFPSVEAMVSAMTASEDHQLAAMVNFMKSMQLIDSLKSHDWSGFARRYNGPNYAANNYDGLLEHFYQRYQQGPPPDLTTRAVQVSLLFKGLEPGAIDGIAGDSTRAAIAQFQAKTGVPRTGVIDSALLRALQLPLPSGMTDSESQVA